MTTTIQQTGKGLKAALVASQVVMVVGPVLIGRDVDRETRKEVLLQMASDMRKNTKLLSSR